jgi:hypothetical protein
VDVDLEGERAAVLVTELGGDVGGWHADGGQKAALDDPPAACRPGRA